MPKDRFPTLPTAYGLIRSPSAMESVENLGGRCCEMGEFPTAPGVFGFRLGPCDTVDR